MFSNRIFQVAIDTAGGKLDILAEIETEGTTLWLRKLSIFPEDPRLDSVSAGAGVLKQLLDEIEAEAKEQGYTFLRITALRISGRNPGRKIDIVRRLR